MVTFFCHNDGWHHKKTIRRKKVVLLLFLLDLINGDDAQLDGVISNCPLGFICYHHHLFSTHSDLTVQDSLSEIDFEW